MMIVLCNYIEIQVIIVLLELRLCIIINNFGTSKKMNFVYSLKRQDTSSRSSSYTGIQINRTPNTNVTA